MIPIFFLLILSVCAVMGWLPIWLAIYYYLAGVLTFLIYGLDKVLALKNKHRVSEKHLNILALLGGWPGAYFGQKLFKHKVSKLSFLRFYLLVSFLNFLVLVTLLSLVYRQQLPF